MATGTIHERHERREVIAGSSDRGFGIVFTVVFAVVSVAPAVFGDGGVRLWAATVAAAFLVTALARPALLAPLNRLWLRFGLLLHRIVNPVIMGLIFFVLLTPVAVVMRLAGRDALRLRPHRADSYWILREPPGPEPDGMKNQF